MVEYKDRLEESLRLSGKSWDDLRGYLEVSYQAMKKVIDGKTKALNAENSARAARFLEVDHFWLATGEGNARPDSVWPFSLILPSQYAKIDAEFKRHIENDIAGEWMRLQQANGTSR